MKTILIALILMSGISHANIFGLHRVVGEVAKDTAKYKINGEVLSLQNKPFITEAMVKRAEVDANNSHHINVTLSQAGARKMEKVTGVMNYGVERVGIVVDGKLIWAPTIQQKLSSAFVIWLPDTYTLKEVNLFIQALNIKK